MSLPLSFHSSVRPLVRTQCIRNGSSVFSSFLHEVRNSCPVMQPNFWKGKHRRFGRAKIKLFGFWRKLNPFSCTFLLNIKLLMVSARTTWFGKIWVLSYAPETSTPILNYNILQMSGGMALNFCMWLDLDRSKKLILSIQISVARHVWGCPKWCQIVSQLISRRSWILKLVFRFLLVFGHT